MDKLRGFPAVVLKGASMADAHWLVSRYRKEREEANRMMAITRGL